MYAEISLNNILHLDMVLSKMIYNPMSLSYGGIFDKTVTREKLLITKHDLIHIIMPSAK